MTEKKKPKQRADHYEKSDLKINGAFEGVIKAAFAKDKKPKQADK